MNIGVSGGFHSRIVLTTINSLFIHLLCNAPHTDRSSVLVKLKPSFKWRCHAKKMNIMKIVSGKFILELSVL